MAQVSSAARLHEIAVELRRLAGVPLLSSPGIYHRAGQLLDQALSLGAFGGSEFVDHRAHLEDAKIFPLWTHDPLVSLWQRAVAVLVPSVAAARGDDFDFQLAAIAACGPIADLIDAEGEKLEIAATPSHKRKKRNRQPAKGRPLTPRQTEVMHILGECKGNLAEVGRRLGIDRKTVKQHYNAAVKKLGKVAVKHATQSLPSDRRGQANLSVDDDRRE